MVFDAFVEVCVSMFVFFSQLIALQSRFVVRPCLLILGLRTVAYISLSK